MEKKDSPPADGPSTGFLAALLIVIAAALTLSHLGNLDPPNLQPAPRTIFGTRAGVGIGIVAILMNVGGGEVLIPTIVLL